MTITATVLDANERPISEEIILESDDDFLAVEKIARVHAEVGTKCCIRWTRSSDGQVAYWGPGGAVFQPHWYAKPGRPAEISGGRDVKVYLDLESIEHAKAVGAGSISAGLRELVRRDIEHGEG